MFPSHVLRIFYRTINSQTSRLLISLGFALFCQPGLARELPKPPDPLPIGNFALPTSQQPGPFISFGQNIVDVNQSLIYLMTSDFIGKNEYYLNTTPSYVYGITENASLMLNIPSAIDFHNQNNNASGMQDISLQGEYYFYNENTLDQTEQMTLVGNISFPTGSINKNPVTGAGSVGLFAGLTYNKTYADWFYFASPGLNYYFKNGPYQTGTSVLYQGGIGKNIAYETKKYIFAWVIEADGTFTAETKEAGGLNPNTGGNVIYLTPSLWFSTLQLTLQAGIGYAIVQHFNGNQNQSTWLYAANIGWSF